MKIGFGLDIHKFSTDRELILGGVNIPFEKGLLGHSDADVLLHSISDALLGACGLGDIGIHFPDTDPEYKGISSLEILKKTFALCKSEGYKGIINIDSTIVCQRPKLTSYFPRMKLNIAKALVCDENKINLKATTSEGLGFEGTEEGISAYTVLLIK